MRKFLPAVLCGIAALSFSAFAAEPSDRGQSSHDEKQSGATGQGGMPDSAEASGGHESSQGRVEGSKLKKERSGSGAASSSTGAGQSSHDEPRSGATGQGGMPDSAESSGGHDTTQVPKR